MASVVRRRPQNVDGPFFVDDTCIDCDTCRWMAPETFHRADGMSAVHQQPTDETGRRRALRALIACPTASIGTDPADPDVAEAARDFPVPVTHGDARLEDVFHCGFHPRSSFGAASYFLRSPDGNVLIDSPRFAGPLVDRLEELGGVDRILLTHRDDVADWARFADRFGAEAWIHADDADAAPGARTWAGTDPVPVQPGLTTIPVPGHTQGHTVFLWQGADGEGPGVLWTGDHLAWSDRREGLVAFRRTNWYSWPETIRSMERLRRHRFEWVLPGHGRRVHLPAAAMQDALADCIAWMKGVA